MSIERMIGFLARRVLFLVPVLLGGSAVVFGLIQIAPGNAVDVLMGPYASQEARALLREKLGLADPLFIQYFRWLGLMLRGDWGVSMYSQLPVLPLILEKFKVTLILTAAAGLLSVLIGVSAGIISAIKQNSIVDRAILLVSMFALSMPNYWLGLVLILFFAVWLGWFPTGGMNSVVGPGGFWDLLWHLVLPAFVAAANPAAIIARVTRSAILEVVRLDYMTGLRAKGLPERLVMRHALRNALPTIVNMTGLQIGYLMLGTALFVEIIFSWPGIGFQIFQSVNGRDTPVILGMVLFSTVVFVFINLAVDISYRVINPRVRAQ